MAFILTIDIGLTILRAGIVEENGECRVLRKKQLPVYRSEPGFAEHDPEELFRFVIELAGDVAHRHKSEISAIVLSAYPFGVLFLGGGHSPLSKIILHTDSRAQRTFPAFKERFDLASLYERTGCPPVSYYPLPRLFHFQQEHPGIFNAAKLFVSTKDYIFLRLTGELGTDPSTAATTQLLNTRDQEWDKETLKGIGISTSQLPPIIPGMSTAATLLPSVAKEIGLKSSIPVIPGFFDGGAVAIGLSGLERKVGVINLATSAMVRVPQDEPIIDPSQTMRLQPYPLFPKTYLNGAGLNNAVFAVDWLREKLFDVDLGDFDMLTAAMSKPPLFCIPSLVGERDSQIGRMGSGVFFGLRPSHSRQDLALSVLEGVAYSLRTLRNVLQSNGGQINEMRMGGPGTSWEIWPQIIADVMGTPISVVKAPDITMLGSAMVGFCALGKYKTIEKASSEMFRPTERIDPDPSRTDKYSEQYDFFVQLNQHLKPAFLEHAKFGEFS